MNRPIPATAHALARSGLTLGDIDLVEINEAFAAQVVPSYRDLGIDIDKLKYVNDVLGHAEGDRYILQVAKLLEAFSEDACLSRLGGDEFMVLAAGIDQKAAEDRLKVLRDCLLTEELTTRGGTSYRGSFSYGVVEVMTDNLLSASEILSQADERMYVYKKAHEMERRDTLT